jgi:endoglucanase
LLPGLTGFIAAGGITANPSYYIWPALQAFAVQDGVATWGPLLQGGERLIMDARFGANSLPTDWIDIAANGVVSPASKYPPRFGFDAIRVPLFLAWAGRRETLHPFKKFWGGYRQKKQLIPAWIDVISGETANYPLSDGGEAVVDLILTRPTSPIGGDYYSSALGLLVRSIN